MIDSFKDEYGFLSNFYPVRVTYEGITYPSVEHAYQAAKSVNTLERWSIATCGHAGKAKKLGQKINLRPDWEDIKLNIMYELLNLKFNQEPFKTWLLATENVELVEGNYWGDTFWGICNGTGENHLGKLLMQIRSNYNS